MELCARAPKFVSKWIRVAVSAGRGTGRRARRENGAVCSCYLRCWFMLIIKRHQWSVSLLCLHALQKLSSIFVQLMHVSQLSQRPPSGSFLTAFLAYACPDQSKTFSRFSADFDCMPQSIFIFLGSELNFKLFSKTMLKIHDAIKSSKYK